MRDSSRAQQSEWNKLQTAKGVLVWRGGYGRRTSSSFVGGLRCQSQLPVTGYLGGCCSFGRVGAARRQRRIGMEAGWLARNGIQDAVAGDPITPMSSEVSDQGQPWQCRLEAAQRCAKDGQSVAVLRCKIASLAQVGSRFGRLLNHIVHLTSINGIFVNAYLVRCLPA